MPTWSQGIKQFFTANDGKPLVGGKLYTYAAGTQTPKAVFKDAAFTIPHANPVVLDARGEALIYWSGLYKVRLTYPSGRSIWTTDNVNGTGLVLTTSGEAQTAPVANFTYTPAVLTAPAVVTCTNTSTNIDTTTTFLWAVNGVAQATTRDAVLSLAAEGSYTISLTVANDLGQDSIERVVDVGAPGAPVLSFAWAPAVTQPLTINVTNTSSGMLSTDIVTWVKGDGSGPFTGPSGGISFVYASAGDYTVTLTITRGATVYGPLARVVNVVAQSEPAPVVTDITIVPSTNLTTTTSIAFGETHTGALNPSGTTHFWSFLLGGVQVGSSSLTNPTFTFSTPGFARVELTLVGPGGNSALYGEDIGQVTEPVGVTTNVVVTAGPAGNVVAGIIDAGTNEGGPTQNLGTDSYINMRRWAGNISRMWVALTNFDAAKTAAEAYALAQVTGSTTAVAQAVRLRLRKLTNTPTDQPATIWALAEPFTEAGSSHVNRTTGTAWTTPGGTKGAQLGAMVFPAVGPEDALSANLAGLLTDPNRVNGVLIELDNVDPGAALNVQPACREWSGPDAPEVEFDVLVTSGGGGGGGPAPTVTDITYSPTSGITTSTPVAHGEAHTGALNPSNAYAWVFKVNGSQVGSSNLATPTFTYPSAGTARAELTLTGPGGTSATYGEDLGTVTAGSGGGGGGGLPAGMSIGYNIHAQAYYDQFGKLLDVAECSAYLGSSSSNVVPDYDGDGYVTINPGGYAVWHAFREMDETSGGLVGSWVVTWTGAATLAVTGIGVTITSTAANRVVFTFDHTAQLADQDADYPRSALSGVFVQIQFSNPTGAPVKPAWHMVRVSDEARFLAGNRFTTTFINLIKTASGNNVNGGFIRFLQAMGGITGWVQTTAEIPRNGGAIPGGWDAGYGPNGTIVRGGRGGLWSPELVARLCVEADRPAFLNLYAMIQDSAWTAWLTRFLAVYPSTMQVLLEDGNETWIFGPQQNALYLRYSYSAAFGTSTITGGEEYRNQMNNAADCAFRQFRIARNLMGTRVRLALGHQSTGFYSGTTSSFKAERTDIYARWSPNTSVRLGDIVDHHAHGAYLSLTFGWPQDQSDTGDMFALMLNKAYENNAFTGGNALAYWQARFATARDQYNSALIQQNAQLASAGFPNSVHDIVYEGWNHDNYTPNYSFGSSSSALAMVGDGTKFAPANVTLPVYSGSRTLSHAGIAAAQFFDNNDRAFIYYTNNTGTFRRGWLVKNTTGGILLFANRSAYNANTPTAVPSGTQAFVINESRLQRVLDYVHDTVWSQNTTTFATHLDQCRARGVKYFSIYAFDQRTTMWRYMTQAGLGVDGKPWGIQKGGAIGATSAIAAYVRDRPAVASSITSARVAEVGHSLVNQNMPQYFAAIAQSLGKTFSGTVQLIGGASLQYNWDNHGLAEVNAGPIPKFRDVHVELNVPPPHDVLVLTCRRPRPSTAETATYGVLWRNRAVAANPVVRVYFYTTWTGTDVGGTGMFWPGIPTRVEWRTFTESEGVIDEGIVSSMNTTITSGPEFMIVPGHRAMMALYDAVVPNVGGLWGWAGNSIDYFFSDDIHLNTRGNYFIACVHYATIYRASPVGASLPSGVALTAPQAQQLQQLAWDVVLAYPLSGV